MPTPRAAGQGTGWPSAAGCPPAIRGLALEIVYVGAAQGAGAIGMMIPPDTGQVLATTPQGHHCAPGLWQPASNGTYMPAEC